jgi:hypothetical protein
MNARRWWALRRYGLAIALVAAITSGLLDPGGTVLDASTRGYSFTHNFLSDLGSTIAFDDQRNTAGALLFNVAMVVAVIVLATALLAVATLRDGRFRARATVSWATLTVVLASFIGMAHLGPSFATERGVVTHVIAQKIMAASVLLVLWLEGTEATLQEQRRTPDDSP